MIKMINLMINLIKKKKKKKKKKIKKKKWFVRGRELLVLRVRLNTVLLSDLHIFLSSHVSILYIFPPDGLAFVSCNP